MYFSRGNESFCVGEIDTWMKLFKAHLAQCKFAAFSFHILPDSSAALCLYPLKMLRGFFRSKIIVCCLRDFHYFLSAPFFCFWNGWWYNILNLCVVIVLSRSQQRLAAMIFWRTHTCVVVVDYQKSFLVRYERRQQPHSIAIFVGIWFKSCITTIFLTT